MVAKFVLIVEDNERNAKLIRDVLEVTGYRVAHCTTAEEGLELVRRDRPDLILMDIQLPGMDGNTALKHLKDDPGTRDIPVIAVTASVMPMERGQILASGFDGYQAKPISVKALMAEVKTLLARNEAQPG